MSTQKSSSEGFTLVELIIAMAVASILMAGIYVVFAKQLRTHVTQEAVVDMQQGLRTAMYLMQRDIRMAGYDPTGLAGAGITTAQATLIEFTMDITGGQSDGVDNDGDGSVDEGDLSKNGIDDDGDGLVDEEDEGDESHYGDGVIGGYGEKIRYSLSNGNILRQYWDGASWQPNGSGSNIPVLVANVDALNFVYLDGNGIPTGSLSNIRTVQISIVGRAGNNPRAALPNNQKDNKSYKNQQGVEIFKANGDRFRRTMLAAEVRCRNLGL